MRITILASGSKGNATLVEVAGARVLIDAGLSLRSLGERARAAGLASGLGRLDAVVVTHAHSDHARGVEPAAEHTGATLYATQSARRGMRLRERAPLRVFGADAPFTIGPLRVRPMPVPHDAPQVALVFEAEGVRAGLVTDLGHVPEGLAAHLSGCHTVLLESNHDPDMLARGRYPDWLKKRIRGPLGHLSNDECAGVLASLEGALERVVLMHLSEENNLPGLARATAERALAGRGVEVLLARQDAPLALEVARTELRLSLA